MEPIILYGILIAVLCVVGLIKNELTYRIRSKWIEQIYSSPNWFDLRKHLPEYSTTFWDMKRWTYISFEDYLKSKENK